MGEDAPKQTPEDVSDLIGLMDDPGMIAAMRGAVAKEKEERDRPALSLSGEVGRENVNKLRLLAMNMISLEEAGPGFYRAEDGTLGMKLDEESAQGIQDILQPSSA